MNILILKPSSLGDVVQALPVLRLLKRHRPTSRIYWWLSSEFLPLLERDPDLAGIFPFERRGWTSPWRWGALVQSVRRMRALHFDWVIDLQGLLRSGAFAWLADGAFTIGVDDPREPARAFYDVAVPRPSDETHAVDWYLEVLRRLNVPAHRDFTWLPARGEVAATVQRAWPFGDAPVIGINPGARWLNKRWPLAHFAELIRRLALAREDLRFAIFGGAGDAALAEALDVTLPVRCLNLAGKTSLPEMIEWLRRCAVVVTNDTGPMHLAAALGRPVVALFGPTNPLRTGPYGQLDNALRAALPCAPCLRPECMHYEPLACLREIQPAQVVAAVLGKVGTNAPAGR